MCASNDNESEAFDSSSASLEIDSDERDSAFGDNQSTFTMSATDSVYNYHFENGRRYHAYSEGKYPVPNDEVEMDRLDLQHHCFRLTLDGALYRAPIRKDVQHVLDVGTGTGIWAIEFADEHPSAEVIGTDLSPIQPNQVPPNCRFIIDDLDSEWAFQHQFDFIHSRALVVGMKDWDRYFEQAYVNLKPGGYFELQELSFPAICMDSTQTPDSSPLLRWSHLVTEAATKNGVDVTAPHRLGSKLRDAGFVDIHVKNYKWPVGRWAKGDKMKLLGRFVEEDLRDWLPSSALGFFTRALKWSRDEVEVFLSTVRAELKERKHDRHFYANVFVWYAQKPEQGSSSNSGQDVIKDEESLEADERHPMNRSDVAPGEEDVHSPGVLAEDTADLSLATPTPDPAKQTASPITPTSKDPQTTEAFKDSLLSLTSEGSTTSPAEVVGSSGATPAHLTSSHPTFSAHDSSSHPSSTSAKGTSSAPESTPPPSSKHGTGEQE